ncbi:hypothetical protein ACBY01_07680 [Sphingomonas sp. ac-8]|uniref:hypothetical protein n=1 Tax=Sphingomonas sp. ac-8 TaxID=3242977 RepID=UPI003A80681C
MKAPIFVLFAASALAACSDEAPEKKDAQLPVGTRITDNGVVEAPPIGSAPTIPTATGVGTAFGLTTQQLQDADLLDGANAKLGEVERVTTDAQKNVNGLVVEIEAEPDREVLLPLTGLEPVAVGDHWHLRAQNLTREQLLTLPKVQ